jgi:hypothetical protein
VTSQPIVLPALANRELSLIVCPGSFSAVAGTHIALTELMLGGYALRANTSTWP